MTDTQSAPPGQPVAVVPTADSRGGRKAGGGRRHQGWSWAVGRDWLLPGGVAAATLFLGAGLAGIPALVGANWSDPQVRAQAWAFTVLGAAGLAVLAVTGVVRRGRDSVLARNGTMYIVQEDARDWTGYESRSFLASARRHFARIMSVPGPGKLGGHWDWPLDDGAQHWDVKAAELTRSFQALHSDDDPATPNGIFIWAWWAVTVAFTARATAADRGLTLDVWQRPSKGRAGELVPAPWRQRPHRFCYGGPPPPLVAVLPGSGPQEFTWPAHLTVKSRELSAVEEAGAPRVISVLLARLSRDPWGALAGMDAEPNPDGLELVLHNAAGLDLGRGARIEIHELRIVPPDGGKQFPWPSFPALVAEVSTWLRRKAAELQGHTLLLGAVMPAEVAAGLGVDAGQVDRSGWPEHLWPIVFQPTTKALVVPQLDLGAAALRNPPGGH